MKTILSLCAAALLASGCGLTSGGRVTGSGGSDAAVQASSGENGVNTANYPQNPYDQPGMLPADSGGTDQGRVGTDPRLEPVR